MVKHQCAMCMKENDYHCKLRYGFFERLFGLIDDCYIYKNRMLKGKKNEH